MQTKYNHMTDTELLALRYSKSPLDEAPLIEELFNRLQEKIVGAPVTAGVTTRYVGDAA